MESLAAVHELDVMVVAEVVLVVGDGAVGAAREIVAAVGLQAESWVDVLKAELTKELCQ